MNIKTCNVLLQHRSCRKITQPKAETNGRIHIFDRKSLKEVGAYGRIGRYAGQFVFMHNLATDSRGNLYVTEVGNGRRVQKLVLR